VQYGVDGIMPSPLSSAFRGCWRYAMAAAMRSAWFVTPADFAKSIMLSALSCWSQTPPVERSALMPSTPARLTHGSFVKMSPPLARQRFCHCCATAGRSDCTTRLWCRNMGLHGSGEERFLRRPSGSLVLAVNWPEEPSGTPEEPPFPELSEDEAGGGGGGGGEEVLSGGAEESVVVVSVGWAELSEVVVESGGEELVVSVESELLPWLLPLPVLSVDVESPVPLVSLVSLVPLVSGDKSVELVGSDGDAELVVQLSLDVRFERSVLFTPSIRLGTSLGETRHCVVVFMPSVTFEMDDVSVIFEIAEPSETAVEFENNARHAGGGVGMSDESRLIRLIGLADETVASANNEITP